MNLYVKNLKLKIASCFMVVFLMCNIILPILKPQKVHAVTLDTITTLMAVSVGSRIGVAFTDSHIGFFYRSEVESIVSEFWAKASEDGMVPEYLAELNSCLDSLAYDIIVDGWVWQGVPHVSGRLLQTLADVIADHYYIEKDVILDNPNTDYFWRYTRDGGYILWRPDTALLPTNPTLSIYSDSATKRYYTIGKVSDFVSADTTLSGAFYAYNDDGVIIDSGYHLYGYWYSGGWVKTSYESDYTKSDAKCQRWISYFSGNYVSGTQAKIKALPTYVLPAAIPAVTVTAIQDESDTIPTDGFASITYEGDQWIYEGDNYYIIDRDAESEPTPTPTPTPDPDQPADDADVNSWLKAIYLKLVSIDGNIAQMLPTVITDLVAINDTLKDISTAGGLNATDPEAQQSAFANIFTGMLEFLKTALVPTQSLNLDALNTMPDNLSEKIPFCLAGDVVRIFTVFESEPTAPKIDIPFDMSSVGGPVHHLDIDFSTFDEHAPFFRNLAFIAFLIGLVWMTIKITLGGGGES